MAEPKIEERAAVDAAFPELYGRLGELDEDGEPLLLNVAAPVEAGAAGDERVQADELPAGRWVTLVHVGPYRSETEKDLAAVRAELLAWMGERGIEPAFSVAHYHVGPPMESDFTKWRTEFAFFVGH